MAALPIVTLKQCKDTLSIVGGTDDALLIQLIQRFSNWIEKRTGRTFKEQTGITDFLDVRRGPQQTSVWMRQFPLTTTTPIQLYVDTIIPPTFDSSTLKVENTDFVVDYETGEVSLLNQMGGIYGNFFPRGLRVVKVVYSAGYITIPEAVQDACIYAVGFRYQRLKDKTSLFQGSKTIGQGSSASFIEGMPKEVEEMLEPFTTVRMGVE